ncbi:hypothetical protein P171DRAFT_470425 [Karstenula rhodostoma CBS 690.94]|uniref:Uncharacterized protein n=1 Tax=Karstenula rhodostoma CBS 690.94 TaxID=1392251 RepID=A0A9P4UGZ2_9PLEO|nr:hypothetical protein P171DRAFT_470425 [Karstenula rhodostoma CBS 690.94]
MPDPDAVPPFLASVRNFRKQSSSRLLSLPAELRVRIYRCIDLSPLSAGFLSWTGVYFASRQLHCEIRDQVQSDAELEKIKTLILKRTCPDSLVIENVAAASGASWLNLGFLQNVIIHMRLDKIDQHLRYNRCNLLSQPYSLFLRHLKIVFTGHPADCHTFPWGDMKSTAETLVAPYVARRQINCTSVTFTLQALEDGTRTVSTLANKFEKLGVAYRLTIVQNKRGRQVERSYYSATRFKKEADPPTSSRGSNHDDHLRGPSIVRGFRPADSSVLSSRF